MLSRFYALLYKHHVRGRNRLHSLLKKNGFNYHILKHTSTGIMMRLDPKNYVDGAILANGSYELEVFEELTKDVTQTDLFWDVGANIGFHSLSLKKRFPSHEVYSFEPDYRNFAALKHNQNMNGLTANLMNIALSNRADCLKIFAMNGNNGMSSLAPWHEFKWESDPHYILTTSGDDLIEQNLIPRPTIIKLDVEGHELEVLQGLNKTLASKKVRKIVFEAGSDFCETESEMKTLLTSFGYQFEKLKRKVEEEHHTLDNFSAFL